MRQIGGVFPIFWRQIAVEGFRGGERAERPGRADATLQGAASGAVGSARQ